MTNDRTVRSRLFPRVLVTPAGQGAQHGANNPCMGNDRDAAALYCRRKELHFIQNSPLKVAEAFAVRCGQKRILRYPAPRVGAISLLNLFPCKAFPLAKVDLAQRGPCMVVETESLRNRHSSRVRPA